MTLPTTFKRILTLILLMAVAGAAYWYFVLEPANRVARDTERRSELTQWQQLLNAQRTEAGRVPVVERAITFQNPPDKLEQLAQARQAPRPPRERDRYFYRANETGSLYAMCTPLEADPARQAFFVTPDGSFTADRKHCTTAPAPEIARFVTATTMTTEAANVFLAATPEIADKPTIKTHCSTSKDSNVTEYGCFAAGKIWILNIADPGLRSEMDVIAVHELLHAAFEQLPPEQKQALQGSLEEGLGRGGEELAESLSLYDNTEKPSELHSRLGSEVASLPQGLEEHYKKYFGNRQTVTQKHQAYGQLINRIRTLRGRIDRLKERSENLRASGDTAGYNDTVDPYNTLVDEYNSLIARYNGLTG